PADHIHVGTFPEAVPAERLYDSVLLSSVDYFLETPELIQTLQRVRERLTPQGTCTLLSWSLDQGGLDSFLQGWRDRLSIVMEGLSHNRSRQFWGYLRS